MSELTITVEETGLTEINNQSSDVLEQAKAIKVTDQKSYEVASAFTKAAIDLKKKIEEFFAPMKKQAHEAHKTITQKEKDHLKPVIDAINLFKRKTTDWYQAEERKRREEEDRKRAELIRKAEEQRLKEAEELEKSGKAEEAEEVLSAPIQEPVFKSQEIEKPAGVSYRDNWVFEIVDETKIPREYMTPDEQKIRGVVKAMKDKTNIPGIKVSNEKIQVNR